MILHALNIPENATDVTTWLEDHLLGLDLAKVVAEFAAVHGGGTASVRSIDDVLGDHLPRVLNEGLSVLPAELLGTLLKDPTLLLQLQVRIFVDGGPYWDTRGAQSEESTACVQRVRDHLRETLDTTTAEPGGTTQTSVERASGPVKTRPHPLLVSIVTAAAVLVAVLLWNVPSPPPAVTGWGWDRPGALAQDVSREAYLNGLAESANAWFKKRPETAPALAKRIAQFRQGCSTLILAEHKPLPQKDRDWLVEKCQAWAKKLDGHLADVEAGGDVLQVRAAADETITKLITALKSRAAGTA